MRAHYISTKVFVSRFVTCRVSPLAAHPRVGLVRIAWRVRRALLFTDLRPRGLWYFETRRVDGQNSQGLSLQLAGSAPIFSPRSAKLFMVSFLNTPGTGGDQSGGMDTTRTWTSALRLRFEISAIAKRCLTAVAVAARVDVSRLR